jgi:RNA polymerase sigma-70 factor (ECF subfamily)
LDERQLVSSVLQGDMLAARALYDAHVARVHRVVGRFTGDPDLAQDFTQEAFIRAFKRLPEFRFESSLGTWLSTIAASAALDGLRKVKRFRSREAELDEAGEVGSARREAEPDLKDRLSRAITALPEIYRSVFIMYDVEGHTHEEVATALGIPSGTSKARLSVARAKLREALADFAGEWIA